MKKIDIASLRNVRTEIKDVLASHRYCDAHGTRVLQDARMGKCGDVEVGAAKITLFASKTNTDTLVFIRSFARPKIPTLEIMKN